MNIRDYRLAKNMTQQELADAIGVSHGTISKYESGIHTPSKKHLVGICNALNISIDALTYDASPYEDIEIELTNNISATKRLYTYASILNPYFRSAIILGANKKCELCGCDAPFNDLENKPYFDLYLIENTIEKSNLYTNVVALCPNCYKKMIVRKDADDFALLKEKAANHNY